MRAAFVTATVVASRLVTASAPRTFNFSLVPGVFIQDDPTHTPASGTEPRFGLIGDKWPDIDKMNAEAEEGTYYKLLFAGRHGQGYHNLAEAKYGHRAWMKYWSFQNGDGEITWGPDPLLTDLGISQAQTAADAWANHTGPVPTVYFSSPLRRALHTFAITFASTHVVATAREGMREHLTGHTCDVRMNITELKEWSKTTVSNGKAFDWSEFDQAGIDADPFAKSVETDEDITERARREIERLFSEQNDTVLSVTAHSGFIYGVSRAMGRWDYNLPTGGVMPYLIKGVETTVHVLDSTPDAETVFSAFSM